MKTQNYTIIMAALIAAFSYHSNAVNCPNGGSLSITGVKDFGITKSFSLSSTATPSGGTYSWSVSGNKFSIVGNSTSSSCSFTAGNTIGSGTVTLTYTYDGEDCSDNVTISIKKPTGESPAWLGWPQNQNLQTIGAWSGKLEPSTVDFSGISVTEKQVGAASDSCWSTGSIYAPMGLTGGTWVVGSGNVWKIDCVGWFESAVIYYRSRGSAPCGWTAVQQMEIVSSAGNINYTSHTIGGSFTDTEVTSTRDGLSKTKTY